MGTNQSGWNLACRKEGSQLGACGECTPGRDTRVPTPQPRAVP